MGLTARAEEWNKRWQFNGKPELHVEADDASVTVEAVAGSEISATLRTRGIGIGPNGIRVIEHQSGNRLDLEVREPHQHFSFGMRSIDLTVQVPRELIAELKTGDGSVHVRGLHGPLRIETGDGSIQGEELNGTLDAHTGDGSVHMRGRFDELRVKTGDGSVDLQAEAGSKMHSDWRVETSDGSIHLSLPRTFAADVDIRTGDGSIHTDIPLTTKEIRGEHNLRGQLNGGGPLLEVKTGDGSVSLNSDHSGGS